MMATDLTNGMSSVKGAGDSLINSLLDSAAIPFFFRAMNSPNATIVDGGLCENLPIRSVER